MSNLVSIPPRVEASYSVHCLAFKRRVSSSSLRGFADLHLVRAKMKIYGCPCYERDGAKSIGLPSRPKTDSDGNVVRGSDGRPQYTPVIEFDDSAILRAFSSAAVAAVELYDARAFDPDSP